ncbi:MAG: hypothetical protein IKX74_01470 [Erysipelotrichaceae bacterium]|nr:hypothetical protein [Erysipelotrichaceae bacterium]
MKSRKEQNRIEQLLQKEYWVIDILPRQVPAHSAGQYPEVEKYFLSQPQKSRIQENLAQILLKLNCYYDLLVCEGDSEVWNENVSPEELVKLFADPGRNVYLNILAEDADALITYDSNDTYMTVFNPSAGLRTLLQKLATACGMFFWQPPGGKKEREEKLKKWRVM